MAITDTLQDPERLRALPQPETESVDHANGVVLRGLTEKIAERNGEELHNDVETVMTDVVAQYRDTLDLCELPELTETTVVFKKLSAGEFTVGGWTPSQVFSYVSDDPFKGTEVEKATSRFIGHVKSVTEELGSTEDPRLTYLDTRRANGGKKDTIVTKTIKTLSPGVDDWISHLPDAERLRIVAHPSLDTSTITYENGEFKETTPDKALVALVGGAADGIAVREREAWERAVLKEKIDTSKLADGTLVLTSLGTGTGEPAMDTGQALMQDADGAKVVVNGFDVNLNSLFVAGEMAARKSNSGATDIVFNGDLANLLSEEGIAHAITSTTPHVIEAIGFSEYVPSDHATDPTEITQRERMRSQELLSAEEYLGKIYEYMPTGTVFMTGNMRSDSPQAAFVVDGLGWKGIIQRDTETYLKILKNAGIPGEAVELYVPDQEDSTGVYNLVCITKL